jgi:hypothetical protein
LASGKIVGSIEENGRLEKVFMKVPLALMCILFLKFRRLDVALSLLIEEEDCNFCLTLIFVAVTMAKKMTYKKKRNGCITDCKFFTRLKPRRVLFIGYIKESKNIIQRINMKMVEMLMYMSSKLFKVFLDRC